MSQDALPEAPSPEPPSPPHPIQDLEARARDVAETLRRSSSRLAWSMLGALAGAATVGTVTVLLGPVRDWPLFLGMYLVIAAYVIAYLKAWSGQRRFVAVVSLIFAESLMAFFAFILADRAPARKVAFKGEVLERAEMPLLWLSAALLILSAILLLAHWVRTRVSRR